MIGMASTWNKDEHGLMGGEIGAFVSRMGRRAKRDLAVVRYHKLDTFCIIEFLSPRRDVFVDTMNLGASLANFDRTRRKDLERRLFAPITCEEECRFLAEADSDYHHGRQNDQAEETERLEKCERGE